MAHSSGQAGAARSLRDARRPVAFFHNGLGDYLLALPTMRALAELFQTRLRLVVGREARATFFADLPLDDVVQIDYSRVDGARYFEAAALAAAIGPCDLFLSLCPWHSRSIDDLLRILNPKYSIGFSPGLVDVLRIDTSKHSADLVFEIARRFDADLCLEDFWMPPQLPADSKRKAMSIRRRLRPAARVVVIHGDTAPVKMWDDGKWRAFLDLVLERWPDFIALVVGLRPIVSGKWRNDDRLLAVNATSLTTALAVVALADVFVGVDSCMLHAADLCGVPGVGLFGPTRPEQWGFRLAKGRHVRGPGAMSAITVDQAFDAFLHLINDLGA